MHAWKTAQVQSKCPQKTVFLWIILGMQNAGGNAASHDASIRKSPELNNPLHSLTNPHIPALFLSP
jgi:hypothetical protein